MKVKSGKNVLVTHPSTNDTELIMVTKVSPAIIFSGRIEIGKPGDAALFLQISWYLTLS